MSLSAGLRRITTTPLWRPYPANSAKRVRLQSYIIDTTGSSPMLTGIVTVNGVFLGRLPLFDLQLPGGLALPLKPSGDVLVLKSVGVTLDPAAAKALNMVFNVTAFQGGLKIGTANISAVVNAAGK